MGIIKGFIFDGIDSHLYGLGITGKDVYNSAERDVEVFQIPGRNGDLIRDKKRFNNIDVTYEAGAFDDDQPNFARKLAELRNALASRKGYQRLEDEYNINEYRMGYYKGGFQTEPVSYQRAGEFEIVFSCLPQRFLKSGENEVSVSSGGKVINPTEFEAKPLLMIKGYGNVNLNGQKISLSNSIPLGDVVAIESKTTFDSVGLDLPIRPVLATGDPFTVKCEFRYSVQPTIAGGDLQSIVPTPEYMSPTWAGLTITKQMSFVYGTDKTQTLTQSVGVTTENGGLTTLGLSFTFDYDEAGDNVSITINGQVGNAYAFITPERMTSLECTAYSSKSSLGNPTYIDLEIGEAYKIDSGDYVSLNNAVSLGGELPVLSPGENNITYDNTITEFKLIPRWWIL